MEYEKLDPQFKALWTGALRSGEYLQGEEYLYHSNEEDLDDEGDEETPITEKYCCLGVACVISKVPKAAIAGYSFIDGEVLRKSPKSFIPKQLVGYAEENPLITVLTHMNDGEGINQEGKKTFVEIADWIETNL